MDTIKAKEFALEKLRQWGLIELHWRFDFDTAKRRFGYCSYRKKLVSLSYDLTKLNVEEEVFDTILHEIAHALAREMTGRRQGHNDVWKQYCLLVGARPKMYYSSGVAKPAPNFVGRCPTGHRFTRFNKPKGVRSCSYCSSKYDERYLITWSKYAANNN